MLQFNIGNSKKKNKFGKACFGSNVSSMLVPSLSLLRIYHTVTFYLQELEMPFIKLAATEIVSGVSGESEEKVRELFSRAVV